MATVRTAVVADATAIGRVHVAAWRAAYAGVMGDDHLAALDPIRRAGWWRRELDDGDEIASVAVEAGTVVGFVLVGPSRDTDVGAAGARDGTAQVHALNVHPSVWGRGVGTQLLRAGEEALAAAGAERALLWVVDANGRARRFYERRGWRADGVRRSERFGSTTVDELRYHRQLDADR